MSENNSGAPSGTEETPYERAANPESIITSHKLYETGNSAADALLHLLWGGPESEGAYGAIILPGKRLKDGTLNFATGTQFAQITPSDDSDPLSFDIPDDDTDVYFCPALFSTDENRRRGNIKGSYALWIDYDQPTTLDAILNETPMQPTAVVESSPGKFHAYWVLHEFVSDIELIQRANYAIMINTPGCADADESGWDAAQVLRLPLGVNSKSGYTDAHRPAIRFMDDGAVYPLQAFLSLPHEPVGPWQLNVSHVEVEWDGEIPEVPAGLTGRARDYLTGESSSGDRSNDCYAVIRALGELGTDPGDIVGLLYGSPLAARYGSSEGRIVRDVERVLGKAEHDGSGPEPATSPHTPTDDEVEALLAELKTMADLGNQPPTAYVVKGYLYRDTLSRAFGASGSMKSFLVLDIAIHVANNMPWNGHRVNGGPVVYIVAEGSAGVGKRGLAWEQYHEREIGPNLHILPRPVQTKGDEWDVLIKVCERIQPVLIVLDTQARISVGIDENDNTQMGEMVAQVDRLKAATGACALLVHHSGNKNTDRSRGASSVKGAVDTELSVERSGGKALNETVITFGVAKQKDAEELPDFKLKPVHVVLDGRFDDDGDPITSVVLVAEASEFTTANVIGTKEHAIKALDEEGVPDNASNRAVKEALKKLGLRLGNEKIAEVVRIRQGRHESNVNDNETE
ncbi:AAA family ATPase [Streptomyces sp. SDT5-1]|uniref:AAA family ATPase n=1 Tax=Streptomyces sp. SDT5-1 TaxID=3406418 RepID=UPI003FD30F84